MDNLNDIRETFIPDFASRPRTREVQGIPLGDVPARTVQDINPTPPNRSQIITVDPAKED